MDVRALEFWAGLDRPGRSKILEALKADPTIAADDFAALPPQVQSGVIAGMSEPDKKEPAKEAAKAHKNA